MNALLAVSIGLTRRWVHVYTAGLPSESRFARRAEIESDLWEQMQEAARAGNPTSSTGLRVLGRMARGTWDDLSWRFATHGIERGASGFVFVALVVAGFALGFLIPGKPDFAASRDEMTAFYGGNLIAIYFGHALIWLSAAFFLRFLGNLRDALRTDPNHTGPDLLPAITFGLGVAACSLVVAAFALTVIAASFAKMGAGPQAIPALYPIAGYMFHYLASAAFAGTLAGVAAASLSIQELPVSWKYVTVVCAAVLGLDAAGAFTAFAAQFCLLAWALLTNVILMRGHARGPDAASRA